MNSVSIRSTPSQGALCVDGPSAPPQPRHWRRTKRRALSRPVLDDGSFGRRILFRKSTESQPSADSGARESELTAQVERYRAHEAAELGAFLPLLVAKQRRLEELEKDAVENHLNLPASSAEDDEDEQLDE